MCNCKDEYVYVCERIYRSISSERGKVIHVPKIGSFLSFYQYLLINQCGCPQCSIIYYYLMASLIFQHHLMLVASYPAAPIATQASNGPCQYIKYYQYLYAFCSGQGRNCCPNCINCSYGPHVARDRRPTNRLADHGHWASDFKSTCKKKARDQRDPFRRNRALEPHAIHYY